MNLRQLLFISVLSLPMGGCSTVQDWFASDDEDLTAPVELERIDAKVALKKQWSTKIGDGQGDGFYKITPILVDGIAYVASSDGVVAAVRVSDGDRVCEFNWLLDRAKLELKLPSLKASIPVLTPHPESTSVGTVKPYTCDELT